MTTQDKQDTQAKAAELRIRQHRARLLMQHPWYGSIGCELELEMDATCDTAWTNGKAIGFNPTFAMSLPTEHLSGVVAHEILHVAMRHNYRRGNRDHGLWNEACDYAINGILIADGFELPADALLADRFKSLSSEAIFATLLAERQQQKDDAKQADEGEGEGEGDSQDGDSQDQDGDGDSQDGGDKKDDGDESDADDADGDEQDDGDEAEEQGQGDEANDDSDTSEDQGNKPGEVRDAPADAPAEEDWKTKVVAAAKLAQNLAGSADSAALDRAVEDARAPKVNWKDMLQQFMTQAVREDFNWSRPSRRHLHTDIHMPSLSSEAAGTIAVAIDTSGSINQPMLETFIGELQGVVDQINPERVIVWCIDTRVRSTQVFERGDLIEVAIVGGGGTCFEPAFEAAAKHAEDIACLIYFTDGYASMPKAIPSTPTLWAITTPQARHERDAGGGSGWCEMPTFGEVAYLEVE